MIEKIFSGEKGMIGHIDFDEQIYFTNRRKRHKFKIFGDGFGLSASLLDRLIHLKIEKVVVIYESYLELEATVEDFIYHGFDWNEDGDNQLILPLCKWKKRGEVIEKQNKLQF